MRNEPLSIVMYLKHKVMYLISKTIECSGQERARAVYEFLRPLTQTDYCPYMLVHDTIASNH